MKVKTLLLIVIFTLIVPLRSMASQQSPMEKLNEISDEALQMIKIQRYEDAKNILNYFSNQFFLVNGKERRLSLDELKIITLSHNEALEAAASPTMKYEERMKKMTKFRLAVDALSSKNQPLWTEMEKQILTAFHHAKLAAYHNDSTGFHEQFNHFLALYDIVYPSMKIDIPAEDIQRLDAGIRVIDRFQPQMLTEPSSKQEFERTEVDLKNIFDDMDKDHADPSLWWVIISTGSIITMTLSYVGWRKYKGEQEMRKNRSREQKH
ncbi:MAG: sporulation protein YpjB [Bacillota bacterium]|nr:sporulation protein YpjB [Bacillota bacterium]MDP4171743.1 sporulation protein YpjB [Bacillota bacterium]